MKKHIAITITLAGILLLPGFAAAKPEVVLPQETAAAPVDNSLSRMKEVRGTVIARTRRNLSVETEVKGTQSYEMLLPFNEKTKLRGYANTDEIKRGDAIRASFEQKYVKNDKDQDFVTGTVATEIELVRGSAEGKLRSRENS